MREEGEFAAEFAKSIGLKKEEVDTMVRRRTRVRFSLWIGLEVPGEEEDLPRC